MYSRNWRNGLPALWLLGWLFFSPSYAADSDGGTTAGAPSGGDFTLSSAGGPVSLSDLRGHIVLMFFGYTSCADVCPVTLAVISRVFANFSEDELKQVKALFISLDPEKDTPELLATYTGYFHPNIIGLTDRMEVMGELLRNYGIRYERKDKPGSALGYVIAHTPDILVVDRDGGLLTKRIPPNTQTKEIEAYVRSLM